MTWLIALCITSEYLQCYHAHVWRVPVIIEKCSCTCRDMQLHIPISCVLMVLCMLFHHCYTKYMKYFSASGTFWMATVSLMLVATSISVLCISPSSWSRTSLALFMDLWNGRDSSSSFCHWAVHSICFHMFRAHCNWLKTACLKARSQFMASSVSYLEYRIDTDRLHSFDNTVQAVVNAPHLNNVRGEAHIDILTYYSKFLPDL